MTSSKLWFSSTTMTTFLNTGIFDFSPVQAICAYALRPRPATKRIMTRRTFTKYLLASSFRGELEVNCSNPARMPTDNLPTLTRESNTINDQESGPRQRHKGEASAETRPQIVWMQDLPGVSGLEGIFPARVTSWTLAGPGERLSPAPSLNPSACPANRLRIRALGRHFSFPVIHSA